MQDAFTDQEQQFRRAFDVLLRAVEEHAFPGAAVAISHRGKLRALKGLGRFTYSPSSSAVAAGTVYDLASLTKVVATTPVCMLLFDRGILDLERPLAEVLPEFANGGPRRSQVTFRMLLAHSSGLPAYVKLFQTARDRKELLKQALGVPLSADPGTRAEYSDIGFILLGEALERITGVPLDQFCRSDVFGPLGLGSMNFTPASALHAFIPPTEDDRTFRQRVIQGEVNDENAYVMGGVASHAGCFSTARDVSVFAHSLLAAAPPFRASTVEFFTKREEFPRGTSRALGWDTPSQPSQSGNLLSNRAYGHLGYTGTSLWVDPERGLSVTLLTNRTWPDRSAQLIKQVRPAFHNAVIEALA